MLNIEEKAPQFCLPNQDEHEICLRDVLSNWIVLYFYPKDNTPGCTTEALDFTQAEPDFTNLGAIVFGVSPDSPKKHRNFIDKNQLGITLLSDEDKNVCEQYGVWQLKKNYGKEYMGVVRSTFLINPNGNIAFKWEKIRVKGHVQDVKMKLEELKNES